MHKKTNTNTEKKTKTKTKKNRLNVCYIFRSITLKAFSMTIVDGTECKTCFGCPRMVLRGPWTKVFSWQCEFGPGRPTPDSQTWFRYLSKKWPVLHCWWAGPCEYSILDSNSEFFVSTRTEHYSDRVVSIINSRIFTIISTINQRQPAMEKIFQDNYSKSWYSKVVVHGKDEQWFTR